MHARNPRGSTSQPISTVIFPYRRAILTNPDLLASTPWYRLLENDFWGTPLTERGSHGSYRPLCVATFRLNHFLGGLEPWGYHLVNVALHAACTVLVVKVARKVSDRALSRMTGANGEFHAARFITYECCDRAGSRKSTIADGNALRITHGFYVDAEDGGKTMVTPVERTSHTSRFRNILRYIFYAGGRK
jgi:hypothetical protein